MKTWRKFFFSVGKVIGIFGDVRMIGVGFPSVSRVRWGAEFLWGLYGRELWLRLNGIGIWLKMDLVGWSRAKLMLGLVISRRYIHHIAWKRKRLLERDRWKSINVRGLLSSLRRENQIVGPNLIILYKVSWKAVYYKHLLKHCSGWRVLFLGWDS